MTYNFKEVTWNRGTYPRIIERVNPDLSPNPPLCKSEAEDGVPIASGYTTYTVTRLLVFLLWCEEM